MKKSALTPKTARTLMAVYDACLGVASEFDAFDGFYKGGADQLLADFAAALKAIGVKTFGPRQGRAAAEARVWDAVNTAKAALALDRGLNVSDYPGENYGNGKPKGFIVKTTSPDGEAVVECPLAFQDWSGKSGLGMIVKIRKPGLSLSSATPVVDSLYDMLKGHGFSKPRVKPDPGPGKGKSAWFVRFDFAG